MQPGYPGQDPYGQQQPPQYGQDPTFGQQQQPPYGDPYAQPPLPQYGGDPYGQQPTTGQPYGQPTSGQPYGQPTSGQPYGQPISGQPYGQPTTGQPYPGAPVYQPANYGPVGGQQNNTIGLVAMILGIIAAVFIPCCGLISVPLGVTAVVMGFIGKNRAEQGQATNRGQALAGLICGGIAVVLSIGLTILSFALNWGSFGTSNF